MKTKINKSRVFTTAWATYREKKQYNYSFSICLVMAWDQEKRMAKYEAKIEVISAETGITDRTLLHKEYLRRRDENRIIGYVSGRGKINYHIAS